MYACITYIKRKAQQHLFVLSYLSSNVDDTIRICWDDVVAADCTINSMLSIVPAKSSKSKQQHQADRPGEFDVHNEELDNVVGIVWQRAHSGHCPSQNPHEQYNAKYRSET